MEIITLDKDIKVICVQAKSFPDEIVEAHDRLHSLIPYSKERRFFGLSRRNENGRIIYNAAAEEIFPNEAEKFRCKTLVIKSGKYISIFISDYLKDIQSIDKAFKKLILQPDIDPEGYCVEWYVNEKDVRCMVRLWL